MSLLEKARTPLKSEPVAIPEWEFDGYLVEMNGTRRDAYDAWRVKHKDNTGIRAVLVGLCLHHKTEDGHIGARAIDDDEFQALSDDASGRVLARLFEKAAALCGLTEEAAAKNFESGPNSSSGTS